MEHEIVDEAKEKMEKSLAAFQQDLGHIRTGRASVGLLDIVEVDVYGTKMKLNQLATVTAPEPRLLVVQPWDKSQTGAIEKAIQTSALNITPNNDGKAIRLPLPQLTEERRKELVKLTGKMAEEARVSIRNIRRHEVETAKKGQKGGEIPEDDAHKLIAELQKATDDFVAKVDKTLKLKEQEIMEV